MKQKAVEWFAKELIKRFKRSQIHYTDSEWSFDMIKKLSEQAKEMEKQQGYNEDDINIMFDTLKENSIDNKITITNVDLFISSWKKQFKNK